MKNKLAILILSLVVISNTSFASHYMGGEVTYEFLDNNGPVGNPFRYRVKFDIYIYCGIGSLYPNGDNGQISFGVYDGATGNLISPFDNVNGVLRYNSDLENTLTNITPDVPLGCNVPGISNNCIRLNTYETIINLPFNANGFVIAHERCCRNDNIINLLNAGNQGHALFTRIPTPINKNSSPQFTKNAIPSICIGDTVTIVNNAFDPDGDILQYEFIAPPNPNIANLGNPIPNMAFVGNYQTPTTTLPYVNGYSVTEPFGPGSYAFIDASTGLTKYMAPNAGNYVVVVAIKEYRQIGGNSVLLGTTRRDIQFIVSDQCPVNQTPVINSTISEFINVFEGDSIGFTFSSSDPDLDNVNIEVTSPILDSTSGYTGPLATFNPTDDGSGGTFTWNTECGMRGSYQINVSTVDDGCPPKTLNKIYTINILPFSTSSIQGPDTVCFLNDSSLFRLNGSMGSSYNWSILNGSITGFSTDTSNVYTEFTTPGNARISVVETSRSGCKDSTFKFVNVKDAEVINALGDTTICAGDTTMLTATGTNLYSWSPNQLVSDSLANITMAFPKQTTSFIVKSRSNLCFMPDTVLIEVNEVKTNIPDDTTCMRDSITIGEPSVSGFSYNWITTEGLNNTNSAQPQLALNNAGIYTYLVEIMDTNLCKKVDSLEILVRQTPDSINVMGGNSVCSDVEGIEYFTDDTSITSFNWSVTGGSLMVGQFTDSIQVNWGDANNNASVNIVATNRFGCIGDTSRYPVLINTILQTETPNGPNQLCLFDIDSVDYSITKINGSTYTWQISSNGQINSGQGSEAINVSWLNDSLAYLFIEEVVNTSSSVCLGKSDTLFVKINPSPDTTLPIIGNVNVCAFAETELYNVFGLDSSSYIWVLDSGGTIVSGQGTSNVTINWDSTGFYPISVLETSKKGCLGAHLDTVIAVRPIPNTTIDTTQYQFKICQNLDSIYYEVIGFDNSTFHWSILGGDSISSTSNGVFINWDQSFEKDLFVIETSEFNCIGDTLPIQITYDPSNITLIYVSDGFENEEFINLNWSKLAIDDTLTDDVLLFRRQIFPNITDWDSITSISKFENTYTDGPLNTQETVYQYYLSTSNICLDTLNTLNHRNILLNVKGIEEENSTQLDWNTYSDWSKFEGVKSYNIYRNLDGNGYELYFTTSDLDSVIDFTNADEGFNHCYRVEAIQFLNEEVTSWSNEVCVNYTHNLIIYNALTPNGDGKNDEFIIKNIHLYPDNNVEIYNRWGNLVYKKENYNNEWDGGNLPDGTYYYVVKIIHNEEQIPPYTGDLLLHR